MITVSVAHFALFVYLFGLNVSTSNYAFRALITFITKSDWFASQIPAFVLFPFATNLNGVFFVGVVLRRFQICHFLSVYLASGRTPISILTHHFVHRRPATDFQFPLFVHLRLQAQSQNFVRTMPNAKMHPHAPGGSWSRAAARRIMAQARWGSYLQIPAQPRMNDTRTQSGVTLPPFAQKELIR